MRILFAGYRDWALRVYEYLRETFQEHDFIVARTPEEFNSSLDSHKNLDAIICVGWSWILERKVVENYFVVGIHPSDLPNFAGGSPIQNQILEGIIKSKNTLFKLTPALDDGPVLNQLPLNLSGHISEILERIVLTSIVMISDFIKKFPQEINMLEQFSHKEVVKNSKKKRLSPSASKLTKDMLSTYSALDLFNFIRCREDPYPNAFYEDDTGKLLFKLCEFESYK